MIPEGTSPEAIIIVVVGTTLVGCGLMAALFWYRFPNMHKGIVNLFHALIPRSQPQANGRTGTDERTDEVSKGDQLIEQARLDKTRAAWIELMVYAGHNVADIRTLLKGENGTIGTEVEAARKRLGLPPVTPYRTPIAGRPTDPKYYQDSPDLEFQPPPR